MADIRINQLPEEDAPVATENVAIDGANTRRTTIQKLVDAGAPIASQAEAEAGTNASKRMTPLTVKQSIASEIGNSIASASQGALALTALQPGEAATVEQGEKADTALQPADVAAVATTGNYDDLSNKPTLGNVASRNIGTAAGTVAAGDDARIVGAVQATALALSSGAASIGTTVTETGAVIRTVLSKLSDLKTLKDFGAVGDGVADDTESVQKALDAGVPVFVPVGNYKVSPGLQLKSNSLLYGPAAATALGLAELSTFRHARFIITGNGSAGFYSPDGANYLNQGGLANLVIGNADGSQVDWLVDIRGPISWAFDKIRLDNTWTGGGGLRSRALTGNNITWLNRMWDVEIRVPDAGTQYALDIDWSDGSIIGGSFTGGKGSIYRGPGNFHFVGGIYDRANSGGAGLTLSKELTSNGGITVSGCDFDVNAFAGVIIRASGSPGGTLYLPKLVNNTFRQSPGATADIYFDPAVAAKMRGPQISSSAHSEASVPHIVCDPTKWEIGIGPSSYASTTWFASTFLGDTLVNTSVIDYKGIALYNAPIFARHSMTFRGQANVSGGFGVASDNGPMVVFGAIDGATPFIAASRTAAGVATDLRFYTDAAERLRLHSGGSWLRPATNNTMALGTSTERWTDVYSTRFRPGAGGPIWTSGTGSPEGSVTATVGSIYTRTDGGAGTTMYVKESGAGNTGWVAK